MENFAELGIDKKTQIKLIEKLSNGEMIDSMKPDNMKNMEKLSMNLGYNESKTIIYPDGSRVIMGTEIIEQPENEGAYTPNKFKEVSPGTYNIKTYHYFGVINMAYHTEFTVKSGSNNDYIIRTSGETASVIGGTKENDVVKIPIRSETTSNLAYSQYKLDYSILGVSGSWTLYLLVGNNGYNGGSGAPSYKK